MEEIPWLPRILWAEVDTHKPLVDTRPEVVRWLDEARSRIILPLLAGRHVLVERRPATETSAWGPPGSVWIGLELQHSRGNRRRSLGGTNDEWAFALDGVKEGRFRYLSLVAQPLDASGHRDPTVGAIQLMFGERTLIPGYDPVDASVLYVGSSVRIRPRDQDRQVSQEDWVGVAISAARAVEASYGYVTMDYAGMGSPFERFVRRRFEVGLKESRTVARGYYWGNILSSEHVERLGGLERVLAEAPCHRAEVISETLGPCVYLQLTPRIDEVSEEELRRLRDFLRPVLPKQVKPGYRGPPLRLVEGQ